MNGHTPNAELKALIQQWRENAQDIEDRNGTNAMEESARMYRQLATELEELVE